MMKDTLHKALFRLKFAHKKKPYQKSNWLKRISVIHTLNNKQNFFIHWGNVISANKE